MRLLLATILIFATVVFLCFALPESKGKVHSSGLLELASAKGYGNLQRRKPPIKIPGPKLSADEDKYSTSSPEKEQKMKKLSGTEKDQKRKSAVNEPKQNGDRKEGSQEEKISLV